MATKRDDIAEIQACITNTLDRNAIGNNRIVGIIGDAPSHYAKSPTIWNPVFQRLKMEAVYLPLDVEESRLPDLVNVLKKSERVMGANVTVPYKIKIIDYLDGLDEMADRIKAVNTLARKGIGMLGQFDMLLTFHDKVNQLPAVGSNQINLFSVLFALNSHSDCPCSYF